MIDLYFGVIEVLYQHGFPGPAATDLPAVANGHAEIVAALRRGDGQAASHALRTAHNDESRRRFTAWRDAHPAPANANGLHPAQAAPPGGAPLARNALARIIHKRGSAASSCQRC